MTNEQEPPGPPVKWETVNRQYDKDERLISERVITTVDTQLDNPEPERKTGFYL
jgi:hypothetical protein